MDLLHSILRSCNSEEYYEYFKSNGIDSFTLKILNREDLRIIGVEDEEKRNNILKHISTLQIPAEKKINTIVDKQYTMLVLDQMSVQLHKHFANLTYALRRPDTDLCDIKLVSAVKCLQNCLVSFEIELDKFDEKVLKNKEKKRRKTNILFPTIVVAALALIISRMYISHNR